MMEDSNNVKVFSDMTVAKRKLEEIRCFKSVALGTGPLRVFGGSGGC